MSSSIGIHYDTEKRDRVLTLIAATIIAIGCSSSDGKESDTIVTLQQNGGLTWMRCPMGTIWKEEEGICDGVPIESEWNDAIKACPEGFRLPSKEEFEKLLGNCEKRKKLDINGIESSNFCKCIESADCRELFNEDTGWYWSKDLKKNGVNEAYLARFGYGNIGFHAVSFRAMVRCVRE